MKRAGAAVLVVGALVVWTWDGAAVGAGVPGTPPQTGVAPDGTASTDGLEPAVARSVERALEAAPAGGVELRVTSGRRSPERQAELFAEAVATHGDPESARRWVLPPEESAHVTGEAVDVGPPDAVAWLEQHGEQWGLCRVYENEPWHFERLAGAIGSRCPAPEPHP